MTLKGLPDQWQLLAVEDASQGTDPTGKQFGERREC
jgi:hypothetical protein